MSKMDIKGGLPPAPVHNDSRPRSNKRRYAAYALVPCALLWAASFGHPTKHMYALRKACGFGGTVDEAAAFCPQVEALYPEKNSALWSDMGTMIGTDAFRTHAINWLSGAVQVP